MHGTFAFGIPFAAGRRNGPAAKRHSLKVAILQQVCLRFNLHITFHRLIDSRNTARNGIVALLGKDRFCLIPRNRQSFHMIIGERYQHLFWQRNRNARTAFHIEIVHIAYFDGLRGLAAVRNITVDIPGFQGLAIFVEHREILPFVPCTGLPACSRHGIPVRLPVEHAQAAAIEHLCQIIHNAAEPRSLSLNRSRKVGTALLGFPVVVLFHIVVIRSETISGLSHYYVLAITRGHVIKILLKCRE